MSESEAFEAARYFQKADLFYGVSRSKYVSCLLCKDPLTEEQQAELRKIPSDATAKLEASRRFGLIPGQKPMMLKHLLVCGKADAELREKARVWDGESKNRRNRQANESRRTTPGPHTGGSARGSADLQSAPARSTTGIPFTSTTGTMQTIDRDLTQASGSQKKRKAGGDLAQTRMESFSAACTCGKRLLYDSKQYHQILAELAATHPNLSFNMFESVEWKVLVSFLCHGETVAKNSRLLPTAKTIRDVALKSRYAMAIDNASKLLATSPLTSKGFTVVSDGWTSRRKANYEGYVATRPGCRPCTFGLLPVSGHELTGLDIASEWETLLLSAKDSSSDLPSVRKGYFINLQREIDCMTSDSAGVNRKARAIIALRHPRTIQGPCFAHLAALDCADLLKLSVTASVVPDCLHLVSFFNASTSKWLPFLRHAMVQTSDTKRAFTLVSSVVTRWTSVWLSAVSVLRAIPAFRLLVAIRPNSVKKVLSSKDQRLAALKRCFKTIQSVEFESQLVKFLHLLIPTIESSLLMQGRTVTLGDVVYSKIRQFQQLLQQRELSAVAALEKRWNILEHPLLLLAFCFTPRYRSFAVNMGVNEIQLETFAMGYANRWGSLDEIDCAGAKNVVSLDGAVGLWFSGESQWSNSRRVDNYSGLSGDFWSQVSRSVKTSSENAGISAEILVLCEVLRKVYSCTPNAADAERLFSELGRIVTPDKTRQTDETVMMKSVIAADVRMRRVACDGVGRSKTEQRRFMDTNRVLSRLKALSQETREGGSAADEQNNVLQSLDESDATAASGAGNVAATPAVGDSIPDPIILEAEKRVGDMAVEDILGDAHEGNVTFDNVLGDDVEDASSSELAATELAVSDYEALVRHVEKGAAELGWDMTDGELFASTGAAGSSDSTYSEAEELEQRKRSFDKHPLGEIPKGSSAGIDSLLMTSGDLPRDKLWGFRGFKISLSDLANSIKLPPMTRIGRFDNDLLGRSELG